MAEDNPISNQLMGIGNTYATGQVQGQQNDKAHERTVELMHMQYGNQRNLNKQGSNLQYENWVKTGAPKQVELLKEAGLNPALMYKQGGAQGTTGSQTGGSAGMGQTKIAPYMDIAGLMEQASRTRLNNAHSNAIENKLPEDIKNIKQDTEGKRLANINQEIINANTEEKIRAEIDNYWSTIENRDVDTETNKGKQKAEINKAYNDNLQVIKQNRKISQEIENLKSQKNLTDRQFNEIEAKLYVQAEQLKINKQNADTQALTLLVNKELKERGLDLTESKMYIDALVNTLGNVIKALPTSTSVTKTLQKAK